MENSWFGLMIHILICVTSHGEWSGHTNNCQWGGGGSGTGGADMKMKIKLANSVEEENGMIKSVRGRVEDLVVR